MSYNKKENSVIKQKFVDTVNNQKKKCNGHIDIEGTNTKVYIYGNIKNTVRVIGDNAEVQFVDCDYQNRNQFQEMTEFDEETNMVGFGIINKLYAFANALLQMIEYNFNNIKENSKNIERLQYSTRDYEERLQRLEGRTGDTIENEFNRLSQIDITNSSQTVPRNFETRTISQELLNQRDPLENDIYRKLHTYYSQNSKI